jgi:hypothetical protein
MKRCAIAPTWTFIPSRYDDKENQPTLAGNCKCVVLKLVVAGPLLRLFMARR